MSSAVPLTPLFEASSTNPTPCPTLLGMTNSLLELTSAFAGLSQGQLQLTPSDLSLATANPFDVTGFW